MRLSTKATIEVPTKVADQYSHKSPTEPEGRAGAKDLAGFMDAPEINEKKKMSNPTIPPIAIPLKPFNPFVSTTNKITTISSAEAATSIPNIINIGKL
ncbi:MAG: hypothetical protein WBY28_01935 [Nitrososphaeraceae archaeon]